MAIELKVGEVYRVAQVRQGSSERGPWQLVKIADPKNARGGATFFTEPVVDGLQDRNDIRIDKLVRAVIKNKQIKIQRTGTMEWATVTDLTFQISKVGEGDGGFTTGGFEPDSGSADLPF